MKARGFTIIEVMLFLAVGGLLTAGILAGSGAMISQQRYKDSVIRLQSTIQQLYANVESPLNTHSGTGWKCSDNGIVSYDTSTTDDWRGASECEVLGRMLQITNGGSTLVTTTVTGRLPSGQNEPVNDLDAFGQYNIAWTSADREENETPWGVKVVKPDNNPANVTILVLRSPLSGTIHTFIPDYHPSASEFIVPKNAVSSFNAKTTLCVNSDGLIAPEGLGVIIGTDASGQSAIEQTTSGGDC